MKRLPKPEPMIEPEHLGAYAGADFEEPHLTVINLKMLFDCLVYV